MNDGSTAYSDQYHRQSALPGFVRTAISRRAAELTFLLLFPLLVFKAFNLSPLNQAGTLDPYIYTGYINNIHDLLQRYGLTYYGVRFGLILPARAFTVALGPEPGYLALRYVLVLLAGVPLYTLVKQRMNANVAALTYCALCTSPFLARSLLWDYPDATAVPYFLAAVCLIGLDLSPRWMWDIAAGGLFGLALNSNVFVVSQIGILAVVYVGTAMVYRHPLRPSVTRVLAMVGGVLLVCFLGALYYRLLTNRWNIFSPTIGMVVWLSRGGMQKWRVPGFSWITSSPHVLLLPIQAVYCILATGLRRKPFPDTVLLWYVTATAVFYYTHQFALNANTLQLFYYFAYSLPAVFLSMPLVFLRLWAATPKRQGSSMAAIGVTGFALPWLAKTIGLDPFARLHLSGFLGLAAATGLLLVIAVHVRMRGSLRLLAVAVATLLVGLTFDAGFSSRTYSVLVWPNKASVERERNVYRVALQFMDAVPRLDQTPGKIRFWYSNRPGNLINSVQSTYLWGYSKCNQQLPLDPGMPHVGSFQLTAFRDTTLKYLGLIGESEHELEGGLRALTDHAIPYVSVDHRILESGDYRVHWQLIRLVDH